MFSPKVRINRAITASRAAAARMIASAFRSLKQP